MILYSKALTVDDSPLTRNLKDKLLGDQNAMKAFLNPQQEFPEGHYLRFVCGTLSLGACRLEQSAGDPTYISIHPLFLTHPAAKAYSRHFIELTILYCLLNRNSPTTFIKKDNLKMNNFASRLGLCKLTSLEFNHYYLPAGWKPKHVGTVTIGWH